MRTKILWVRGLSVAAGVAAVLAGCIPKHMELQRYGKTGLVRLPLDEVWETVLENDRGRSVPEEAEATCTPADRCKAVVLRSKESWLAPELLLDVIGLSPGLVDVAVRYRQYDSQTWLTDHVSLEFVSTKPLPMLELGMGRPRGSFMFDHLSPELLAYGIKGPARCELESDFHEQYECFGVEEVLGEQRYGSCAHTRRCGDSFGIVLRRFRITLRRDENTGRIFRFSMDAYLRYGGWVEQGTWE